MAGRKVEGRAHAQACLDAVAASGLSRRDWAVAHGIDGRSLHVWQRILTRKSPVESVPLRFVEIVPATTRPCNTRDSDGHEHPCRPHRARGRPVGRACCV